MINYSGTSEQLEEGIKTLTLVERERLQHPQIHSEDGRCGITGHHVLRGWEGEFSCLLWRVWLPLWVSLSLIIPYTNAFADNAVTPRQKTVRSNL